MKYICGFCLFLRYPVFFDFIGSNRTRANLPYMHFCENDKLVRGCSTMLKQSKSQFKSIFDYCSADLKLCFEQTLNGNEVIYSSTGNTCLCI